MATRYCDPAASGADNGTSWGDAYETLQKAADNAVAGDTVYCRGTETLAATVDFDTNAGSTSGPIKFIGCNAGGTVDGTKFVLDGNNTATNCILAKTIAITYLWFENFEIKRADTDGVDITIVNTIGWTFVNCLFHLNGRYGLNTIQMQYTTYIRCKFYDNSNDGINGGDDGSFYLFCSFYGNGGHAIDVYSAAPSQVFIGCIFHDNANTLTGIEDLPHGLVFNCVFEGTDSTSDKGIEIQAPCTIIGCRFANLTAGIELSGLMSRVGWNYFHDNTDDTTIDAKIENIRDNATVDTNEYDVDADDGFNDVANNDFNLKASRTLRRTAIDLEFGS